MGFWKNIQIAAESHEKAKYKALGMIERNRRLLCSNGVCATSDQNSEKVNKS